MAAIARAGVPPPASNAASIRMGRPESWSRPTSRTVRSAAPSIPIASSEAWSRRMIGTISGAVSVCIDFGITMWGCCNTGWQPGSAGQRSMPRPYPVDMRERMVWTVEAGLPWPAPVRRFEVSVSCVIELMQPWRRDGTVSPDLRRRSGRAICGRSWARRRSPRRRPTPLPASKTRRTSASRPRGVRRALS